MKYLVLLIMIISLAACGGGETPAPTTSVSNNATQPTAQIAVNNAAQIELPQNSEGVAVVARVNGEDITQTEFARALTRTQQQSAAADPSALSASVLDTLIEQTVINQAAEEMQIAVSDDEVNATIESMRQDAGSDDAWQTWLASNLYTQEEFTQDMRDSMITLRVRDAVTSSESNTIQQVHARHILVSTEAEAQAILTRLNNGEDFGVLAAELSRDVTTKERGGDLGFFIASDLTTPELAEVALGLQPGEIAGPVATALGYHIIQTIEFSDREALPEDEPAMVEARFNSWLQSRLESATIERYLQG